MMLVHQRFGFRYAWGGYGRAYGGYVPGPGSWVCWRSSPFSDMSWGRAHITAEGLRVRPSPPTRRECIPGRASNGFCPEVRWGLALGRVRGGALPDQSPWQIFGSRPVYR